jgi:hypothetical protein
LPIVVPSHHPLSQTYPQELLAINPPVAIKIELLNHRDQFFLAKALTKLSRNAPKIRKLDPALAAGVKELERSQDLLARIAGQDLLREQRLEGRQREEEAGGMRGWCPGDGTGACSTFGGG